MIQRFMLWIVTAWSFCNLWWDCKFSGHGSDKVSTLYLQLSLIREMPNHSIPAENMQLSERKMYLSIRRADHKSPFSSDHYFACVTHLLHCWPHFHAACLKHSQQILKIAFDHTKKRFRGDSSRLWASLGWLNPRVRHYLNWTLE